MLPFNPSKAMKLYRFIHQLDTLFICLFGIIIGIIIIAIIQADFQLSALISCRSRYIGTALFVIRSQSGGRFFALA